MEKQSHSLARTNLHEGVSAVGAHEKLSQF